MLAHCRGFYDGITRPQPDSEGRLTWPADISEMRVWFLDPVVPPKGDGRSDSKNDKAKPAADKPEAKATTPETKPAPQSK